MIERSIDSQRPLTAPRSGLPPDELEADFSEAVAGKLSAWGTHGGRAAGDAVRNAHAQDYLLMSADAVRSAGDAIKNATGSSRLGAGAELSVAFTHFKRGNLHDSAYHIGKALDALGSRAGQSRLAAAANAVVLTTSSKRLKEVHRNVGQSAQQVLDAQAPDERAKAALEFSGATWQLAYLYQLLGKAAVAVSSISLQRLARVPRFAPAALRAQAVFAKAALTPLGRAAGAFTRWVPMLNIVGLAMSGKTAVDVFRDDRSSKGTLALAAGGVALAGAGLWAAIALGFWPFLGVTAVGIGLDVALLRNRKRDRARAASVPPDALPSAH